MRGTKLQILTMASLVALLAPPSMAQEEGAFGGAFQIGFRSIDVNGNSDRYNQDINLEDGPRLFLLEVDYIPEDSMRKFADKVTIDLNNLGGDPFETLSLAVQKFGRYDLRYDRRKSDYFYQDIILPVDQAGDPALARAGDFHHFAFDRVQDSANFKVWVNQDAIFNFGFNRYTRRGESTTTLDISRDEFEFEKPVDESLNDYLASFQYSWDKVTLVLEERYRDFDNAVEIFLPGQSLGEDPNDATILDFYFLNQPYNFTSNDHIVRLVARPNNNLLVRAQADIQSLDLDLTADETGAGISFAGQPFEIDSSGDAKVKRDMDLFDLDLTYRFNNRWALTFAARQNSLDQQGNLAFDGEPSLGTWQTDTTSLELGGQVHLSPKVTLAAGVRQESREIESRWEIPGEDHFTNVETDQDGFFANVGWAPVKGCRVNLELEDSSFDDPFTLSAPTDRQRYKLRGQYKHDNGFSVLGAYIGNDLENSQSGWDSKSDQFNVRVGYDKNKLNASLGYSSIDVDRKIDQTVTTLPGFGGGVDLFFPIAYDADSKFFDGRIRYKPGDKLALGGDFRLYDNSGSWEVERQDYRGWVEVGVGRAYLVHFGYRVVDYDEIGFDFDDYDANIAEISFGYHW